jgi:hypothetical protein
MNLFHPQIAATLAATLSLAACVAPPAAPTIPVAPGPNKTSDRFDADQAACQQYAATQISPAVAAANNQAVGGALLGAALGAGLGAGIGAAAGNAGKGAAIGAASGGALGIIGGAGVGAPFAQESLQQQYDIMYGQCMAIHGNSVASFSPHPGTTPYSGDLPPYYHDPPPYAPIGAPYPARQSRRRATEPVARLERLVPGEKCPDSSGDIGLRGWQLSRFSDVGQERATLHQAGGPPAAGPIGMPDRSRESRSG